MADTEQLESDLSRPTDQLVGDLAHVEGDLLVLGAGGKMGPSLCRLAARAFAQSGCPRSITAVSRFGTRNVREQLEAAGIATLAADLLAPGALASLPEAENVVLMVGYKFGSTDHPEATWATNVVLPALVAQRFPRSRIVALSTGNVYPMSPVAEGGSREDDPVNPIGEYAQSALGRERVLQYAAIRNGTPMMLLRLNYAVEPRYGVLRDVADHVATGVPINLTVGFVNVIWQRDANAIVLRALRHVGSPAVVLNLTGPDVIPIRDVAEAFGRVFEKRPIFAGTESDLALLSDASRCHALFGPPPVALPEMIERVARWVLAGGESLGKPTRFQQTDGRF